MSDTRTRLIGSVVVTTCLLSEAACFAAGLPEYNSTRSALQAGGTDKVAYEKFTTAVSLTKSQNIEGALTEIRESKRQFEQSQNFRDLDALITMLKQKQSSKSGDEFYPLAWAYVIRGQCAYSNYRYSPILAREKADYFYGLAIQSFDDVLRLSPGDACAETYKVYVKALMGADLVQCEMKLQDVLVEYPQCAAADYLLRQIQMRTHSRLLPNLQQ